MSKSEHASRVRRELSKAGITRYALLRAESRYLPSVIHEDEHVMAAVYGRTNDGSAMLVATDKRILFVDKKPMVTVSDEVGYEVVSGIKLSQGNGVIGGLTLFTRIGNYTIRYANVISVRKFRDYLEKERLEGSPQPDSRRTKQTVSEETTSNYTPPKEVLTSEVLGFLHSHELGVLSTIDRAQQIHGSAIYYVLDPTDHFIYILTKSQTQKAHNILSSHQVALTVYDEAELATVQLQGIAEIEANPELKTYAYTSINRVRNHGGENHHPPVTKLSDGHFIVFKITPITASYTNFKYSR